MTPIHFDISITTDNTTGAVLSAYFQIRKGKVHTTREFANGNALADYNRDGELLGVELIGPCKVTIVDQLAANEPAEFRKMAKTFIKQAGPRELVA